MPGRMAAAGASCSGPAFGRRRATFGVTRDPAAAPAVVGMAMKGQQHVLDQLAQAAADDRKDSRGYRPWSAAWQALLLATHCWRRRRCRRRYR